MIIKGLKVKPNTLLADGWALAAEFSGNVEKDADGVPVAWMLFKEGDNELTRRGEAMTLTLNADDLAAIGDYYAQKGTKIPVDSRHALFSFAQSKGVDEADAVALGGGKMAVAFGEIRKRPASVWIENVDYKPFGRELMKAGAIRYFSPVLRGLADGRLRITSVALENEPALNKLDAIAASAEDNDDLSLNHNQETHAMKKLLQSLAGLLGCDSIALGAENDVDQATIDKINNVKIALDLGDALRKKLRDSLALGAEAADPEIVGALQGLTAKGAQHDALKAQVDALALAAETDKRDKLIETALADGKLTNDQAANWAKKQDSIALSAYLSHAPVVVPQGQIKRDPLPDSDSAALSADDQAYCRKHGYDETEFLKAKGGK